MSALDDYPLVARLLAASTEIDTPGKREAIAMLDEIDRLRTEAIACAAESSRTVLAVMTQRDELRTALVRLFVATRDRYDSGEYMHASYLFNWLSDNIPDD